jgi:imidazolonepropionase-like amidohydrolase
LGSEATADASQFSDAGLVAIVEEARRNRVRVAAYAHGIEGVRAAIEAGVDSIEHGSQLDLAAARRMKEKGTFLVPAAWANTGNLGDGGDRCEGETDRGPGAGKSEAGDSRGREDRLWHRRRGLPAWRNARDFAVLVDAGMSRFRLSVARLSTLPAFWA